ncbi:MAG: hypothetical protein AAFW66_00135, partial [Pseudomonadota bacterium]
MKFLFGGDTGETPESIKRKREIAASIIANQRTARSLPEGLHVLGQAIKARRLNKEADEGYRKGAQEALDSFGSVFGGGSTTPPFNPDSPQGAIVNALKGISNTGSRPSSFGSFNDALAQSESGGRTDVVNSEGFTGKYQFGQPRLDDFNRASGTNYTTAQLRQNPELQETVQNWHVNDIDQFVSNNNLDRFIGQNVGGANISQNSMRAVAHLGGKGGLQKFLESGGQYNPADSNGTSLSNYAAKFSGVGQSQPQAQPQPVQVAQAQPDTMQLLRLANNPYLPKAHQQYVLQQLQQIQQANDPLRQLQIQKLQNEVNARPERKIIKGADGFQYYQDNGERVLPNVQAPEPETFTQVTGDDAAAMGLDPAKAYNIGPDGKVSQIGGNGTNVTVNNGASSKFQETVDKKLAEQYISIQEGGQQAQSKIGT